MSLKVMCAGCSAEEKERAESDVRRALGPRATGSETWIVSVVNLQSRWSVVLDGPGIRALNCSAPLGKLAEAIQQALQARLSPPPAAAPAPPGPAPAAASAPPAAAAPRAVAAARPAPSSAGGARRNAYSCAQCQKPFIVSFDLVAGEAEHMTPVACPHCWHLNSVPIGENAADTNDYRAEKG